jgi:hypothetical protein
MTGSTRVLALGVAGCVAVMSLVGIGYQRHVASLRRIAILEAEMAALSNKLEQLSIERQAHRRPMYFDNVNWRHDQLYPSGRRLPPEPNPGQHSPLRGIPYLPDQSRAFR